MATGQGYYQGRPLGRRELKFGDNSAVGTSAETIWPEGGLYTYPSAAGAATIESADANDAAAGTGARTVYIEGVGDSATSYAFLSETATLNGTTPVALSNSYFRINRMRVITAGSGGINAGKLTAKIGATTVATIRASEGSTMQLVYTVPTLSSIGSTTNEILLISLHLGAVGGKAVVAELWAREPGGVMTLRERYPFADRLNLDFSPPEPITPGEDIEIRAYVDVGTGLVSGTFGMVWI